MSINAQATIIIQGGVIQEVYCNYAGVQVQIIDLDDLAEQPDAEQQAQLDYVRNSLGKVY